VDDGPGPIDDRATLLPMRIQLKPGLPRLRRGPSTVQIGLDPRHGTLVDGLTDADLALLTDLATGVDDSRLALPTDAGPHRVAGLAQLLRARMLVSLLGDTGVLQRSTSGRAALVHLAGSRPRLAPDAAAWSILHPDSGDGWELLAHRRRATVELRGGGRTALVLAGTLAAAGIGTIHAVAGDAVAAADAGPGGALPVDVGHPVAQVVGRIVARTTGRAPLPDDQSVTAAPAPGPAPTPDLVVVVERGAADPTHGDRLLAADVPHLSVVVRETSVVVGRWSCRATARACAASTCTGPSATRSGPSSWPSSCNPTPPGCRRRRPRWRRWRPGSRPCRCSVTWTAGARRRPSGPPSRWSSRTVWWGAVRGPPTRPAGARGRSRRPLRPRLPPRRAVGRRPRTGAAGPRPRQCSGDRPPPPGRDAHG